jgi:hypothetical protein
MLFAVGEEMKIGSRRFFAGALGGPAQKERVAELRGELLERTWAPRDPPAHR